MSIYLTSINSQARAASGTVPDENYAREIMQLFSVGLWMLNADGTQMLDAAGEPIPTYGNADIVSQARIWTGLRNRQIRGNYEIRRNPYSPNQVDPLTIREVLARTLFTALGACEPTLFIFGCLFTHHGYGSTRRVNTGLAGRLPKDEPSWWPHRRWLSALH